MEGAGRRAGVRQGADEVRRLGRASGSRPPASARCRARSCAARAYIAPGVVLMPCFVNVGAYVDRNTMIDTWSTVGSCAQIGKNCHISGGVGIGGVLEPLQANPVIIEDDCFIGARSRGRRGRDRRARQRAVDGRLPRRLHQDHRPRHRRGLSSAACRPIRWWSPARCRASRCRTARPARRSPAR